MKKQDLSRLHEHVCESERLVDNLGVLPLSQGAHLLLGAITVHLSMAHDLISAEYRTRSEREAMETLREALTDLDQPLPFED